MTQTWDLWFPQAGAAGLPFARTRLDPADVDGRVLVHAAPPVLQVVVTREDGAVVARGDDLQRGEPGPISFLVVQGDRVSLEDGWPTAEDLGRLVLLPGGESGVLKQWWHAPDRSEWRWQVEFYNHV